MTGSGRGRMLAAATIGYTLNLWAWALLGPLAPAIADTLRLTPVQQALVVAAPVVIGALGRIPIGALTDRFGGHIMLPVVSLATVVPVLYLGLAGRTSLAGLLVGGLVLGIGGTAFAAGVPLVSARFPPARRGLAIGVFGMGICGSAVSGLATLRLSDAHGPATPFVVVAAALGGYAVIAVLLRDPPGPPRRRARPSRTLAAAVRLRITWRAGGLYAIALSGYVAFTVYLPSYLENGYGTRPRDAATWMAVLVLLAVVMRPVGGRLSDRVTPTRTLTGALAVLAGAATVQAFTPGLAPVGTMALLSIAAALGVLSAATLALVAQVVPPPMIGSVAGIAGAVGGVAGFLAPLVMGSSYGRYGSYGPALTLLAVSAATALLCNARSGRRGVAHAPGGPPLDHRE